MREIKFEKSNSVGNIIRAKLIYSDRSEKKVPLVIMLTGDGPKGSKSLSWSNIPPKLLKYDIASLIFDFSGLGESDGERKFLTLSQGIDDFKSIVSILEQFEFIDKENIGIMASSYGASVALSCPDIINTFKVIGLKSPCGFLPDAYFNEITKNEFSEWMTTGFCTSNGYDKMVMLDAFQYNLYALAKQIKIPSLITHGLEDEVVPISQTLYLKEIIGGKVEFIPFEGCDHGYSGDNWEKMANIFESFYRTHLT